MPLVLRLSHEAGTSFQLTSERNECDVGPTAFDAATGPIFRQPWFWLAIVGVIGMVALTISGECPGADYAASAREDGIFALTTCTVDG